MNDTDKNENGRPPSANLAGQDAGMMPLVNNEVYSRQGYKTCSSDDEEESFFGTSKTALRSAVDIQRITGLPLSGTQQALDQLVGRGLVTESKQGNRVYYLRVG